MIAINYLAATTKNFGLSFGANAPMQTADEETESQNLKENNAIFNFANFFDSGIDLTDNSIVFGDSSDYYGWMFHGVTEQTPTKDFELVITALETIDLADGLTIAFNKGYSCAQIKVYLGETLAATVTAGETDNYRLPSVNKITFTQTQTDENIKIVLQERYGATCCPNIKGVYFGNSIDIDEVFDYDHIAEIDPLSNDLPINESNFTAYIPIDFTIKGSQSVNIFDNGKLFERQVLYNAEETEQDVYEFKARSKIQLGAKDKALYNYTTLQPPMDWSGVFHSASAALDDIELNLEYPGYFKTEMLSQFLEPCTTRKLLQQVAWATCCGLDTTHSEKIVFVPFLAQESTTPDIVLTNDEEKILETSVKRGAEYSKIIWEITKYNRSDTLENIGKTVITKSGGVYFVSFESTTPFTVAYAIPGMFQGCSPYYIESKVEEETPTSTEIKGHKYNEQTVSYEISTGLKSSEVLRITDQQLYPTDPAKKLAQLKKWYSANNTLSATVADKDGLIRIGKVLKIQLKKGGYFQGIITKVERDNIADYHTVSLEAHQWD